MRKFCENQSIPADGVIHSYDLANGAGISRYRQGYLAVDLDVGAGTENISLALQCRFATDGEWFDAYVLDLTPRQTSTGGTLYRDIPLGTYADIFLDHAEETDWSRAFSPEFVVDTSCRAVVQNLNTGNFTVRVHNDGEYGYGYLHGSDTGYGTGYDYGEYGDATEVQIVWERWGRKAQETDGRGGVASVVLTADTQAVIASVRDFHRYMRLRVTNNGANAATLTAGFYA